MSLDAYLDDSQTNCYINYAIIIGIGLQLVSVAKLQSYFYEEVCTLVFTNLYNVMCTVYNVLGVR